MYISRYSSDLEYSVNNAANTLAGNKACSHRVAVDIILDWALLSPNVGDNGYETRGLAGRSHSLDGHTREVRRKTHIQ